MNVYAKVKQPVHQSTPKRVKAPLSFIPTEVALVLSVRDLGTIPSIHQIRDASHENLYQLRQYDLPLPSSISAFHKMKTLPLCKEF